MPTSRLSEPGTEFGPCVESCSHVDCAATRRQAASKCRLCRNAIGYGERYYTDPDDRTALVHAVCLEASLKSDK